MKYYSEETVKGLLEQLDSHFVKYLENLPSIEIKEPHGDLIERSEVVSCLDRYIKFNLEQDNDISAVRALSFVEADALRDGKGIYKKYPICIPTVLEASTPSGFCNTEGCSNSKPDMSKAQNHICPYYKGVCSLDENILCYCEHHYEMCEKFIKVIKEEKK